MGAMEGSGFAGRMEVLAEPTGRRAWPLETKLRIVVESCAAGVSVGEVARRNGLLANQVTRWRRQYRQGELVPRGSPPLPPMMPASAGRAASCPQVDALPATGAASDLPAFVPLMLEDGGGQVRGVVEGMDDGTPLHAAAPAPPASSLELSDARAVEAADPGRIEVEAGGVVVRLPGDVAPARLAAIVAALRGAAGTPARSSPVSACRSW